jgi:DNA-directed RNA polymerase specialized sigma24 family protein
MCGIEPSKLDSTFQMMKKIFSERRFGDTAGDIFQDVLIRLDENGKVFDSVSHFKAYMYKAITYRTSTIKMNASKRIALDEMEEDDCNDLLVEN